MARIVATLGAVIAAYAPLLVLAFCALAAWSIVSLTRNVAGMRRELERITERLDRLPLA